MGLSWADTFSLLFAAGEHAVSLPLAETMIARWLLASSSMEAPEGIISIAAGPEPVRLRQSGGQWRTEGTLKRVPWGRDAAAIVTVAQGPHWPQVILLKKGELDGRWKEGKNLAGEPRQTVSLEGVKIETPQLSVIGPMGFMALAAATRAVQMAGALQRILALSVEYANLREQFGRPIGRFQVVQHSLTRLAGQAASARSSAEGAMEAAAAFSPTEPDVFADVMALAAAKICCGEAASSGALIAHQTFGAIGYTDEHVLHRFTKRLWSWRDEFGSETFWSRHIGERYVSAGQEALWPALVDEK